MTPKEKAKELIDKFMPHAYNPNPIFNTNWISEGHHARQIALIAVDEISEEIMGYGDYNHSQDRLIFWGEVKSEIEKLSKSAEATEPNDEKEYQP